jgi:uncharacterized repeat protein (TIGR03943 family)
VKYRRLLLALVGLTCLRLALTGQYKQYVRVGMGRYLALAGIALGLLALADIVLHRSAQAGHEDQSHHEHEDEHQHEHKHERDGEHQHGHEHNDHGHDHSSTPKIAWLLLLPIAVAFAVVPPALGKWGIDRSSNAAIVATRKSNYLPLKPSATPLPMATNEFVARAFDQSGSSLKGVTVSIEGFVIERNDNYVVIGRYSIACCAADAVAAQVYVQLPVGTANIPGVSGPQGEWVRAVGSHVGTALDGLPKLIATDLVPIAPPANTYEG